MAAPRTDRIVVLSGAGLSAASGVPTFRGEGGWWRGHQATELATPEAFARDPELVLDFYAMRREVVDGVQPNAGHRALVALQEALGPERVSLVTQNVDGLIQASAAADGAAIPEVFEMHGTLWRVRCSRNPGHPIVEVGADRGARGSCVSCGAALRPHIVWFGEIPQHMDTIAGLLSRATLFVSVGTSGVVYPAAGFCQLARRVGAWCVEVNPDPTGGAFDEVIVEGAESALPRLVAEWT